MKRFHALALLSFLYLSSLIVSAYGRECTCEAPEEGAGDHDKAAALRLKLIAIVTILGSGTIGVFLPVLGRWVPSLSPEKDAFLLIKAFAGGVILATAFIHILPEAFERLSSPCLPENPWEKFPFAGFVIMLSAIGTLMVDAFATGYYHRAQINKSDVEDSKHGANGRSYGTLNVTSDGASELLKHRVISHVLELGIIVHSVIIGVSLGASHSPPTIRPLIAALSFHQFFEGLGLGGSIALANFRLVKVLVMSIFFSLTTPIGIAIGIGAASNYDANSPTALAVEGIFDSASAGILVYMALVDLLAADYMSSRMQESGKLQFWVSASLLLGVGCMSLLAIWA